MAKNYRFDTGYTFDDVALVPQFNNVPSRTEPMLDSWLTKNRKLGIPLLCANMDTTISEELAEILIQRGSIPIYHRFTKDFEAQERWVKKFGEKTFISCGIGKEKIAEVRKLFDMGAAGVCVDVAHGHSEKMLHFIEELKKTHPDRDVIAGNVCTPMAYQDLVNAGADGVKVGVGPGAACTTRVITRFGVPQFTAVISCAGALNGWILVQGQIPMAAAKDGLFQRRFGKVSKNRSPVFGIVLSSVLVTLALILNFNKNLIDQFTFIISLATLAGIIAYLYTSVAEFVIYIKYPEKAHKKKIVKTLTISGLAFLYTFWATVSAGQEVVFYGSLLLFSSIPIYGWMEWQKYRSTILN